VNRLERLDRIIREINKGRYPSRHYFQDMFECSERLIFDDIAYLKNFMELDIKLDQARGGYYNADPTKKLPEFNLTVGEVFALTLGKDMLTEYSGTVFEPILTSAVEKIEERLPEKIRMDLPNLVSVVRFKTNGIAPISKAMFFDLNRACEDSAVVNIQYASPRTGQTTFRDIEPLKIIENRGAWYVISWCRLRDGIRMFALHRILGYKISAQKYAEREVDIDNYLNDAFLLEHGDPLQTYVIKFDSSSAPYVRERQWHASQELINHDDGSCTLSISATSMDEVRRWVLGFGASAEVLQPAELRTILKQEFAAGADRYATGKVQPLPKKRKAVAAQKHNNRNKRLAGDDT
jgi:predicted DNA-binding transcriptional regulator YafY